MAGALERPPKAVEVLEVPEKPKYTEILIKEPSINAQISIKCDPEQGKLFGWELTYLEPQSLGLILNLPNIMRPAAASTGKPCGEKTGRLTVPVPPVPKPQSFSVPPLEIGEDGKPILDMT